MDEAPDVQPGAVRELKTGGYAVASASQRGVWWLVWGKSCSCPAGQAGHERCPHRTAVARHVADLDAKHRRPSAPPNVEALCG